MDEIVSPTLTLFPTSLSGFSPFSPWLLLVALLSLLYCPFPPPPLQSTRSIQCWSICDLCVAPAIFAQLFNFPYFVIFLGYRCDVAFTPTSIFDRSKLSLIVQSQCLVGRFLHSLNVLLTYFL